MVTSFGTTLLGFATSSLPLLFLPLLGAGAEIPGEYLLKQAEGRNGAGLTSLLQLQGVGQWERLGGLSDDVLLIRLGKDANPSILFQKLRHAGAIEYAEPNYEVWLTGDPPLQSAPGEVIPPKEDPALRSQWHLQRVAARPAWEIERGSRQTVVAVIDTGIDYNHPDLSFNQWRNPRPTQGDIVGYDFVNGDGRPHDDASHGTMVAGLLGAVGGNGIGVSGIAQKISIMSIKAFDSGGKGTTALVVQAIDYAISHGARIMSGSWSTSKSRMVYDAIERARERGVLFVVAAGNSKIDNDGPGAVYPAAYDNENLISVAASDSEDRLADFSNFGLRTTALAAPGVQVLTTAPGGSYNWFGGTSAACPIVAGAAAVVWSLHPEWSYRDVKKALLNSVDVIPYLKEKVSTGGRLNVLRALEARAQD